MTSSPVTRCGDAVVVSDGATRLGWRRVGPASWTPTAVWPSAGEASSLRRHVREGRPLLILLSAPEASVPLLDEQLAEAPDAVTALVREAPDDLPAVGIPALDWLPADLRKRGLRFLSESAARAAELPPPLRPALSLDEPDIPAPHVRFAHRLRACAYLERDLPAVVAHVFGEQTASVAA